MDFITHNIKVKFSDSASKRNSADEDKVLDANYPYQVSHKIHYDDESNDSGMDRIYRKKGGRIEKDDGGGIDPGYADGQFNSSRMGAMAPASTTPMKKGGCLKRDGGGTVVEPSAPGWAMKKGGKVFKEDLESSMKRNRKSIEHDEKAVRRDKKMMKDSYDKEERDSDRKSIAHLKKDMKFDKRDLMEDRKELDRFLKKSK